MQGTSQGTSRAAKVFGAAPRVVFGAVVTAALAFPPSANAQQLPWLAAPPQGAPSAVTTVPKTPLNRAVPGSRYVPDVQAPPPQAMQAPPPAPVPQTMPPGYAPAALAPSPVMPVPNAPIAPAYQAAPYAQPAPSAQPAPAMRPALAPEPAPAAPLVPGVPAWLNPHIGDGEGQISATVLKRAHDFHQTKVRAGAVKNSCYFAFDATRPGDGAKRFYVICENNGLFRAVSSGHGAGRNFPGIADLSNGTQCAKNFSNARNSHLTTGGGYVTAEVRTSFKGYYHDDDGYQPLMRSFLQYEGEGETVTARVRAIGGHSAAIVRWQCRMKMPSSKHADSSGYVPYGKLVDYSAGRSSGCTSWPREIDETILGIAKNKPTTVYVYPEAKDIVAVGRAVRAGQSLSRAGLYWSATCLREIGAPNFWPREKLEPALLRLAKKSAGRPRTLSDLPVCKKTVVGSAR